MGEWTKIFGLLTAGRVLRDQNGNVVDGYGFKALTAEGAEPSIYSMMPEVGLPYKEDDPFYNTPFREDEVAAPKNSVGNDIEEVPPQVLETASTGSTPRDNVTNDMTNSQGASAPRGWAEPANQLNLKQLEDRIRTRLDMEGSMNADGTPFRLSDADLAALEADKAEFVRKVVKKVHQKGPDSIPENWRGILALEYHFGDPDDRALISCNKGCLQARAQIF